MIYSDCFFSNHVGSAIVKSNTNSSGELQKIFAGVTSNPKSYWCRRYGKTTPTIMPTQTPTISPPPPPTPQTTTTKTWTSQYRGEQLPQVSALLYNSL